MILLALVLARVSRQFRLAVVHLQLVSHICRQLSQNLVAAEHVLAVHHQADGLVVPEQLAVASLHARQFLDEFVEACALLQLEGLGVENYGVATHSDARHLRRHLHLLQHERRGLQPYCAKVGGVVHLGSVRIVHLARVLVTYHAEREHYATLPTGVELEATGAVGLRRVLYRPSRLWVYLALHCCSDENLARLGVYDLSLERVGCAHRRLYEAEQQCCKKFLECVFHKPCVFILFVQMA